MLSFSDGALDDDSVLHIASYLALCDLVSLSLTCRRFGSKFGTASRRASRRLAREAKRQKMDVRGWSLMDEAARSVMEETQTEVEKACLPLRDGDSWMSRYNELALLRRPLAFDQLIGDGIGGASNDKSKVWSGSMGDEDDIWSREGWGTAVSSHVMRAGKHYASFELPGTSRYFKLGVFRPVKELAMKGVGGYLNEYPHPPMLVHEMAARWGRGKVNYCTFHPRTASGKWSDCAGTKYGSGNTKHIHFLQGPGPRQFSEEDTIGLLLDLDEGTLSVYRNGRRLGLLKSGLAGEYCWCAEIYWKFGDRPSLKLSRGSIPS